METKKIKTFSILLLVLLASLFLVFISFIITGKSLAWISTYDIGDGTRQHATFLKYIFDTGGVKNIGSFDFKLGLGADYFGHFIYYLLLDPFNFFLYLFPFDNFLISYSLLVIIKLLTCGIFMFIYLKNKNIKDKVVIIFSCLYMLGGFMLFTFPRHPDLSGGAIYLPLIIMGLENIMHSKRPYLFIITITLCFMSSFYMFYMVSCFVVFYAILYYFKIYKKRNWQSFINIMLKVALFYLSGVLISSFALLPLINIYLDSARQVSKGLKLFNISYYLELLSTLVFPSFYVANYTPILLNFIMVFALIPFFIFKGHKRLKICFIVLYAGLYIPIFGYLLNFFNYSNNRWIFLFDFTLMLCLATTFNENKILHEKVKNPKLNKFLTKYYKPQKILSLVFVVSIVYASIAMGLYSIEFDNGKDFQSLYTAEEQYVASLENNQEFFRTDKENQEKYMLNYRNTSLNNNYQGTHMYNTISNENVYNFLESLGMYNSMHTLGMSGLNQRVAIQSLLSTKYYIKIHENSIPFGYMPTSQANVYENQYYLPLGFVYNQYLNKEDFDNLKVEERQIALMDYLVSDTYETSIPYQNKSQIIDYEIVQSDKIEFVETGFNILQANAKLVLKVTNVVNSELYLNLYNYTTTAKTQNLVIKTPKATYEQRIVKKGEQMYSSQNDFSYNLGYYNNEDVEIQIIFKNKGRYNLDDFYFSTYSMSDFTNSYNTLKQNTLQNINIETNKITGNISLDQPGCLFLSIPYSKGWKAYVDNQEVKIQKGQIGFMMLELTNGDHQITLTYETYLLKEGIYLSFLTCSILIIYILIDNNKRYFQKIKFIIFKNPQISVGKK